MASRLYYHLQSIYEPQRKHAPLNGRPSTPVQVDDQNDGDNIERFCTVFVTVKDRDELLVELEGKLPVTEPILSYASAHHGGADKARGKVSLRVPAARVSELSGLADLLRETGKNGFAAVNPDWPKLSERTAGTLERLVETVREYRSSQ
jgi:hypothetical protein